MRKTEGKQEEREEGRERKGEMKRKEEKKSQKAFTWFLWVAPPTDNSYLIPRPARAQEAQGQLNSCLQLFGVRQQEIFFHGRICS